MSMPPAETNTGARAALQPPATTVPPARPKFGEVQQLAAAVFAVGVIIASMYGPFTEREWGDDAIYDYIAQTILRGGLPYRDVVEIKAPGSIYLSALAMAIGRTVRVSDVASVRALHVLMIGLFSAVIFLVAVAYFNSRLLAITASLFPLLGQRLFGMCFSGTQPKLPLMIFGLVSLLFIARNRPFLSGVCSMLACLCWQPGLMFTGVAFLIFTRYLTRWRDLAWLKVLAGAALPLAATLLYFFFRGALGDLWSWTITFNYSVFAPLGLKPVGVALSHVASVVNRILGWKVALLCAAAAGLLVYAFERVRAKLPGREGLSSPSIFKDAILMPPVLYLIFSIINFQAGPDLIPFYPFIAIFFPFFLLRVGRFAGRGRFFNLAGKQVLADSVPLQLSCVALLVVAVYQAFTYKIEGPTLSDQQAAFAELSLQLAPGDQVYVHEAAEVLVLLNIPNANRYIAFDTGADDYISAGKPNGFSSVIDEIESGKPKVLVLSRLAGIHYAYEIVRWAEQHYDRYPSQDYLVYVRKPSS